MKEKTLDTFVFCRTRLHNSFTHPFALTILTTPPLTPPLTHPYPRFYPLQVKEIVKRKELSNYHILS